MSDSSFKRNTKDDLSWFKLSNYDAARMMDLADWRVCIFARIILREHRLISCNQELRELGEQLLAELLANPMSGKSLAKLRKLTLSSWFPKLSDLTVFDVFVSGNEVLEDARYLDALNQCKEWTRRINEDETHEQFNILLRHKETSKHLSEIGVAPRYDDLPLVHMSFDDYMVSKGQRRGIHEIVVNLNASDAQLVDDFKEWLAMKRKTSKVSAFKKPIANSDMRAWSRYGILPYVDIRLFCLYTGSRLTYWEIGELLFPNEQIDAAERIRKVVKPMAERLMEVNLEEALHDQVARTERKGT